MSNDSILACLFVDEKNGDPVDGHYSRARGYECLDNFVRRICPTGRAIRTITDIRPFQLRYRSFQIYVVDIGGYPAHVQAPFMLALGNIVRARRSRLFLFWSSKSLKPFRATNPDLIGSPNCIDCTEWDEEGQCKRQLDKLVKLW